ncbi:hypothetical protein [Bradyrhizobium sp. SZCCHNS3004]|uniref:hypothetical protein n=1 Tax=Bradyrhizobium sp. SZCCHNS3004 TaxID=3057312 RepID=UPI00291605F7|nr:hypothetical protein [Bradyrhizobium sp. SZCCHNS3004]
MTVLTDLKALSLSQNAKNVVAAKGANLDGLISLAQQHTIELQAVLKQIIAHHPSGGGDAANYAALSAVLAQLV